MKSVAAFHHEIEALLRTRPGTAALGPLADASVYIELVFRQREDALKSSFPQLVRAWEALPKSFRDLVFEYCKAYPPRSLDPNRIGENLSDFLVKERAKDASLPAYLEEIADFEYLQYKVFLEDFSGPSGLNQTLYVRHYSYNVLQLTAESEAFAAPTPASTTVIVCRHRTSMKLLKFAATQFDVLAIARREGMSVPEDPRITEAEQMLIKGGVLA